MEKIQSFIQAKYAGLTAAEQTWRFVLDFSQHKNRVTKNNWHNNPLLLMNSSGGSQCGFRSATMVNILNFMGENARAWCVQGHVICEVLVEGKWQVYDPDLGVIYFNKNGAICSFEDLCTNPDLITSPYKIISISSICDSLTATSPELAQLYASREDNTLFRTDFPQKDKCEIIQFELPPNAKLSFPLFNENGNEKFALACLEIPPKWNGNIHIPLILYDLKGTASVFFAHRQINGGKKQIQEIVSSCTNFEYLIEIKNNNEGIKLYYLINPLIYFLEENNNIMLIGKNIGNIMLSTIAYSNKHNTTWANPCDEELERLYYLTQCCNKFIHQKVDSREDYFHRLAVLNDCDSFKQFDLNPERVAHHIDSIFEKYEKSNDTIDWKQFERIDYFLLSISGMLIKNKGSNIKGKGGTL
jgi:hypothetical protein